jgi:Nitroreductase family
MILKKRVQRGYPSAYHTVEHVAFCRDLFRSEISKAIDAHQSRLTRLDVASQATQRSMDSPDMNAAPFLLTDHTAERLIASAILAPSSHNTQPWRFEVRNGGIDLYADRARAMTQNDPDGRELIISCGCALYNLRVAAAWMGLVAHSEPEAHLRDDGLLARVSFEQAQTRSPEADLCIAIYSRHTYRKPFASTPVSQSIVDALIAAASAEHAHLHVLTSAEQRSRAIELIAAGDSAQWADPQWRRELANWMNPKRKGDGLPIATLSAPVVQLAVRTIDMGDRMAAQDRETAHASPLLSVLSTKSDGHRQWFHAGQALERMLLTAQTHGVQASFLNQPIQVTALRPQLRALTEGNDVPQMLIRWGVPLEQIPSTPRRAIDAVITPRWVSA